MSKKVFGVIKEWDQYPYIYVAKFVPPKIVARRCYATKRVHFEGFVTLLDARGQTTQNPRIDQIFRTVQLEEDNYDFSNRFPDFLDKKLDFLRPMTTYRDIGETMPKDAGIRLLIKIRIQL
uniref:Uncharacterized protein n=1 Tax=Romanomermis culicivorax TaxID=13658 RepID=A0A915J521_ROMCU